MSQNSHSPVEHSPTQPVCTSESDRPLSLFRAVRAGIGFMILLLLWDVVLTGSYVWSVLICPVWFVVSIIKNAIQRPGWIIAAIRIAVPAFTLWLAVTNEAYQYQVGEANSQRIIAACEDFHAANGKYPESLDDLVPRYLPSVPRAKYCLQQGEFVYWPREGHPVLMWYVVPPYGRKSYDFEKRRWNYVD